jgi:hypothetical protein
VTSALPALRTSPQRWLTGFAVAFVIGHHTGTGLAWLGTVGPTRWADWVDLALPYVLLGLAATVLWRAEATRLPWLVLGVGGVVYTQGHGIHLAANSIGNELGHSPVVTLWDEVLGHYLWYGGFALVVAALVLALPELRVAPTGWVLACLVALTLSSNAIEGQTVVLSAAIALAFLLLARQPAVRFVYALHVVALAGWVGYWALAEGRWAPEFTELGWV